MRPSSLSVDLAPVPSGSLGVDLDGRARNTDLPSVINAYGPRDLGAYELQNLFRECGAADSVFCDGYDHR